MSDALNSYPNSSVDILERLIRTPSENPGGDERAIVAEIGALLRAHGVDHEVVSKDPTRPSIVAKLHGGPGPRLILQGHIDTKPAAHAVDSLKTWSRDPFDPQIIDDRLYGLGACDTKGGVAAQLAAVLELAGSGDWSGTLEWQGIADEENGSRLGAEFFFETERLKADAAIVSEPTSCQITTAQLGNCWADIRIIGRAAHAGTPWKGVSATDAALEFASRLKERVAKLQIDPRFPGHPRLNVGILEGGHHAGTLPGEARLVTDIRVRPKETRADHWALVRETAREIETLHNVEIKLSEFANGGCESVELAADHPFAQQLDAAWRQLDEGATPFGVFFGGSDARYFAAAGTPVVVFGPGSLEQAHAIDEFVPVQELPLAARFYASAVRTVLGEPARPHLAKAD